MLSKPLTLPKQALLVIGQWIRPAEQLLLSMIVALGIGCLALTTALNRQVEWADFAVGIGAALLIIAIGVYVRVVKAAPRLALCAIGVGIFMSFTALAAIFIFALFPLANPLIDSHLIAADAAIGYDWAGFVTALAGYPVLGSALGYVYLSSLPQIVLTILLLGALGRETQLHRFLLVGIIAMVAAVAFWWLFPSVGPAAYHTLPEGVAASIGLVTTPEYGAHMLDMVYNGLTVIRSNVINGVVAFPSYHIIMALMVAWFSFRTLLFAPLALASLAMIPATLSHGGHHVMDLVAGLAVFAACVWVAGRIIPAPKGQ